MNLGSMQILASALAEPDAGLLYYLISEIGSKINIVFDIYLNVICKALTLNIWLRVLHISPASHGST